MSTRRAVSMLVVGIAVLVGLGVTAQDAPACEGDTIEAVRELGTAYVRAMESADLQIWSGALADDFEAYYSGAGFMPLQKDTASAFHSVMIAAAPNLTTAIESSEVSDDCRMVTAHWTSSGLFFGLHGGYRPNGRVGQVSGTSVAEIVDGRIVREWITYDPVPLPAI